MLVMLRYESFFFTDSMIKVKSFQLVAAKIMEMGPVLVVTFQAQQIAYISDANGKVVEGDPVSFTNHFFKIIYDVCI